MESKMRLSISNIAWDLADDEKVYEMMKTFGYSGLEIAPTRIFPEDPYEHIDEARRWRNDLYDRYGFTISSMQSIWYGRQEKLFGNEGEREALLEYTKKAIDFAEAVECGNLVFGCPKNRVIPDGQENRTKGPMVRDGMENIRENKSAEAYMGIATEFFSELGNYAHQHGTVLAMEANPAIYNTNFINTTAEAVDLVERVDSEGFRLNLDSGTMVENDEPADILTGKEHLINHVHFSEPYLKPVARRDLHREIAGILRNSGYEGFVSIETGRSDSGVDALYEMMKYVSDIFENI